jgi:hypothetical protein
MLADGWGRGLLLLPALLGLAALLCGTSADAAEEKPAPEKIDPAVEKVQHLLRTVDSLAVAELLEAEGESRAIGQHYYRVMNDLYWKRHDLPAVVTVARLGIHYCIGRAQGVPEAQAAELRGLGKTMAYDLASFTWPGWDEDGIRPTPADEALGLDAARLNLRLAIQLKRGAEPMMNAHWMLGAQQLGAGQFAEAIHSFEHSAEFARQEKNRGAELMAQGYAILAQLLEGKSPTAQQELRANAEALPKEKDGEFFRDQIAAAQKVFTARFKR